MAAPIKPQAARRFMSGYLTRLAAAGLLGASAVAAARAQTAAAPPAEHCEGTLCDLYYGTRPASAAGTTPATSPAAGGGLTSWFGRGAGPANAPPPVPASSANGYMALGAGGVLGSKQEHCSGTLCDLYYGSSASSDPATKQEASATSGPAAVPEPVVPHRHIVHESETRPKCSSPTADPWHCYR